ncbi:diguanylate cyclase [Paucibacter sp. Y2R2-4]|uniref:sensor domain-containing diguanylate cyclase n=1 Tax=Paucibacter sp. Y2R2-4 TaxID=2893553 RepID=UPI0021E3A529|nr:diguanylate cyclase [Paucibacter sp. Y2R2-4]MCV2350634.1 sensor domain-containing diguanylate cyclase [Paucibacter sp. Y2R2-4]
MVLSEVALQAPITLGDRVEVFVEAPGQPLDLQQARAAHFHPGTQPVLSFGLGARPVWLRLRIDNPQPQALNLHLQVGTTWLDRLEVYVLSPEGQTQYRALTGDEQVPAQGLTPVQGFVLPVPIEVGRSELYVRLASNDPMLLPLTLMTAEQAHQIERQLSYGYGFLYGFLLALCAYNLMIYLGLRERSYLFYGLYLLSIIGVNMAYTGHGYAWLWPDSPLIQRHIILALMVLFGCSGLLFAARFLALAEHAPRVLATVRWFCALGLSSLALLYLAGQHVAATYLAFAFVSVFTVLMVALGVLTLRHGRLAGRYFLMAALCGMVGTAITALSVCGLMPYRNWTFHALELGIVIEATLLVLALAHWVREQQRAALRAEQLSRLDPLTGLRNRRSFWELAESVWSTALRNGRPLSLVMLDLDHFKQINEHGGHQAGDQALIQVAEVLTQERRSGDVLARWGGEEFMLLLPETQLEQACALAERIRLAIEAKRPLLNNVKPVVTCSLGVVELHDHVSLEALIHVADERLRQAKKLGRNRVEPPPKAQPSAW